MTIIAYYLNEFETAGNTLSDISFDNLPFLVEVEPVYNMKGQKVSKSYTDTKGREVVRIVYNKLIEDYTHNEVVYNDVWTGISKDILYLDFMGNVEYRKKLQPYKFNLQPVFIGDGTETITGFSSQKQRKILKEERFSADDFLQAQNPQLYALIYGRYTGQYEFYLKTGKKDTLVSALNNEDDTNILAVLDTEVYGLEPMTVKELIIYNLQ